MPLSWNEIKARAIAFSREWAEETRETAEAKSFWDAFFNVFGMSRRAVASFEEPVRSIQGTYNRIDLFWKGKLLAEHKSAGKDLAKAKGQAFDYVQDLIREGRQNEAPDFIATTDFARLQLYDLNDGGALVVDFPLRELHRHVKHFAFIAGYQQHAFTEEPTVNLEAADIMSKLADTLEDAGYPDHQRQLFLVRLLFCLFANDTGIFDSNAFDLLIHESAPDGKDLGPRLAEFFETLDLPREKRQTTLDETLAGLPYVNGGLFAAALPVAHFNAAMRTALLDATRFDWSRISPAVFGALFQGVMEPRARRQIGAHYTSEANILKVIRPLFLDGLQDELQKAGSNHAALNRLHDKLAGLKFLDPACGCGNFLVIAYRELRKLETGILCALHQGQTVTDIAHLARLDVDQFHGIEIDEWPARIAEVALWLMDHQMNNDLAEKLGQYFARLPLTKSAHILCANALRTDWNQLLPPEKCAYVMGNPPFVGFTFMSAEQKADMAVLFPGVKNLDFVTGWFKKAADYIQNTAIECAFVSTNSICQGESVAPLWRILFGQYGIKINFAHQTFKWTNEARGKAAVHCVIIGFALHDRPDKIIFAYPDITGVPEVFSAKQINAYLLDAPNIIVGSRNAPLSNVPPMVYGSKPADGGHLILEAEDYDDFIAREPGAKKFIRPLLGAVDFLHNKKRYCLWLVDANPTELQALPLIRERIRKCKESREASIAAGIRKFAATPSIFAQVTQPRDQYIIFPRHSSESRKYIPLGYFEPTVIVHDSCMSLANASLYHFGVLTSAMHMAWMRQVAGRLKSDYRYSKDIVYNTFPWPEKITDERKAEIERLAQAVLDERAKHLEKGATLADLYDPVTMPPALAKAHAALDRAVDRAYRSAPFETERARVEHLFGLYQSLTSLFPEKSKKMPRKKSRSF